MKKNISFQKFFLIIFILIYPKLGLSEPFIVLEYRGNTGNGNIQSNNIFLKDRNYHTKHTVLKNETLSDIMLNYYGSKSFNNNILSLAIVHFNKKAFVRNNPNYLYSGKKIYLPSVNQIKNLVIKENKNPKNNNLENLDVSSKIYFFGG